MNTYSKYYPNVFLAKCTEPHEKGDLVTLTTKYGKENECIIFNLIYQKEGYYYYSIIREDGFTSQEWAKRKAERLQNASNNANKRSNQYWEASQEGKDIIPFGQPILVGHHSEKGHRALIERNFNRMGKSVEFSKKAEEYDRKAEYFESKADKIDLSMPESVEFFEFQLEKAKKTHEELKADKIKRSHSYSLTYAKKAVTELEKKIELAKKLWS